MSHLVPPHGGSLVELASERTDALKDESRDWPSWDLTPRQLSDLELLLSGAYSPLRGFMSRDAYDSCVSRMQLPDGAFWPVPVVLDLPEETAAALAPGTRIALRDTEGVMLAALTVEDVWTPDLAADAARVFGTSSLDDPSSTAFQSRHTHFVGGAIEGVQPPVHYDFRELRFTPAEMRAHFTRLGWRDAIAYHPSGPMHRAEHALTLRAAKEAEANLLIAVPVGGDDPSDPSHYATVRALRGVMSHYPQHTAVLALLPLPADTASTREQLLRALVARNYGCSHVLAGDAGVLGEHESALGVTVLDGTPMRYIADRDEYLPAPAISADARVLDVDDAELRRRLDDGRELPPWFTFPEVARELRAARPPRSRQGFTVFFTGLSGSGKSTIANALTVKLLEMGGRPVTLLDGDLVRKHLSSELGFSKEDRNTNIRRVGFVASEISKNGGIAICAFVSPYDEIRKEVRARIERRAGFVLVHVATALEVCEARDRKGLYARARAGIVKEFTGISDPYEEPEDAEVVIDTVDTTPEEAAQRVVLHLEREGYIGS